MKLTGWKLLSLVLLAASAGWLILYNGIQILDANGILPSGSFASLENWYEDSLRPNIWFKGLMLAAFLNFFYWWYWVFIGRNKQK